MHDSFVGCQHLSTLLAALIYSESWVRRDTVKVSIVIDKEANISNAQEQEAMIEPNKQKRENIKRSLLVFTDFCHIGNFDIQLEIGSNENTF